MTPTPDWETTDFFEWIEDYDRVRESIDSRKRRRRIFNERGMPDTRGPNELQRQAFELRLAMFPGLTTA